MDVTDVRADLLAEQQALDDAIAPLGPGQLHEPTASPGWSVAHQLAHLTWFDRSAAQSISDPEEFAAGRDALIARAMEDPATLERETLGDPGSLTPGEAVGAWRAARDELAAASEHLEDDSRVDWYGPPMSARSFLTARLMEVWAHGQDVLDALGREDARPATDRLRHIAHLGVVTRGWSYSVRGTEKPEAEVRVELEAPSGELWSWGPAEAADVIRGPAEHFCLVVTQRRHIDDTDLVTTGNAATEWMHIAQAFAGGPTQGPPPGAAA